MRQNREEKGTSSVNFCRCSYPGASIETIQHNPAFGSIKTVLIQHDE